MKIRQYIKRQKELIKEHKGTYKLYKVLRFLVIVTAVLSFLRGSYESVALCILSLLLFLLPSIFEEKLRVDIPGLFQGIIYLFIFAAEILGEVNHDYTAILGWATMLHTINGFLCAAIGFSLVYILNRNSKNINLSPFYLILVSFCFSMTIGVLWEFIEFTADQLFYLDMQKDFIIKNIGSVTLDPTHSQITYQVKDIIKTVIYTKGGTQVVIPNGYLDVGLLDTMKDLLVNFIGAIVFSVIGYFYLRNEGKGHHFLKGLIVKPKP